MLLTALILGFAGSLHCVGMCSPLIMAVTAKRPFIAQKLFYNTGRIFIYGGLGVIASTAGIFIHLSAYQQVLSFIIGGVLLIIGFGGITGVKIPFVSAGIVRFTIWLKMKFGYVLQHKGPWSSVVLGMLNGLLPCGLTYLAMTYCLTLSTWWEGFLFMFFFGLGTWPVMLGATSLLGLSSVFIKRNLSRLTTILFLVSGCLLIGRAFFIHDHQNVQQQSEFAQSEVICR
ncbi:MAG: sulfite exporter TauE/SafE family protein [Bacteroidia bacterium]|nr:sulfite exporter TauE/SafE family protein [Bacteroidia bacterium]